MDGGRMSSNQDPTPPTTAGMPHLDEGNIHHRPIAWFLSIDVTLFMAGTISYWVSPTSSAWATAGFLLMMLSASALVIVPGALLALGHPSGALPIPRLEVERHYAHPRLVGLALMWGGLVISGLVGAFVYLTHAPSPSVLSTADWWKWLLAGGFAVFLVGMAPMLALAQFDRRR